MEKIEIHENVVPKVADNIRKEAREVVREAGEGVIRKLTDRGFRDADVRKCVREGAFDAVVELGKAK